VTYTIARHSYDVAAEADETGLEPVLPLETRHDEFANVELVPGGHVRDPHNRQHGGDAAGDDSPLGPAKSNQSTVDHNSADTAPRARP
jgi:hypothetical protein